MKNNSQHEETQGGHEKISKHDHARYVASARWKERKQKLLEDHNLGDRCEVCYQEVTDSRGPTQRQVHHNNYYRKNNGVMERDEDLIVLCYTCHELFHAKSRASSRPVPAYENQCSTCGISLGEKIFRSRDRSINLCYRCNGMFQEQQHGAYIKPRPKRKTPPSKKPPGKIIRRRNGSVVG